MQTDLAQTFNAEGQYAAAEKLARATYEAVLRINGPQHPRTLNALRELGKSLAYTHRYAEAGKLFRDAIEKQDDSKAQGNRRSAWYSSPASRWPVIVPMTRFSIYKRLSSADLKMRLA
jgi:tetratricopeptide (TPR) repeat protein